MDGFAILGGGGWAFGVVRRLRVRPLFLGPLAWKIGTSGGLHRYWSKSTAQMQNLTSPSGQMKLASMATPGPWPHGKALRKLLMSFNGKRRQNATSTDVKHPEHQREL
jgi:hypothetical protein